MEEMLVRVIRITDSSHVVPTETDADLESSSNWARASVTAGPLTRFLYRRRR